MKSSPSRAARWNCDADRWLVVASHGASTADVARPLVYQHGITVNSDHDSRPECDPRQLHQRGPEVFEVIHRRTTLTTGLRGLGSFFIGLMDQLPLRVSSSRRHHPNVRAMTATVK